MATLCIACEKLDGIAAAGEDIDLELYGRLTDRLGRALHRLGLKRQQSGAGNTLGALIRADQMQRRQQTNGNANADDDRRTAVARRLVEAGKALRVFQIKDRYWARSREPRESERAFGREDYDRAEHLADVVLRMVRRDTIKFQADPKKWIDKIRELQGERVSV